jgi:hypothetical protein
MVRQISGLIIVTAIIVTGFISLGKLNYYEKSMMVFKVKSSGFPGEFGGGRRSFEGRGPMPLNRNSGETDTLRRNMGNHRFAQGGGNSPGSGFRGQGANGGRGHVEGKLFNLKNVSLYLSVFALFTVITVYFERGCRLVSKKMSREAQSPDHY